jgi:thiosulfate reductase cytochrome b subunit
MSEPSIAEPGAAGIRAARPATSYLYDRHAWPVRVMHWVNVLSLALLLMSGLMIFNAHPALDWGESSYTGRPSVFEITNRRDGSGQLVGVTRVFGREFDTTGVLGVSAGPGGTSTPIAFPSWITVPGTYSLAAGRLWHFFFAWLLVLNGVAYVTYAIVSRHLQRDLLPTRLDWRHIGRSVRDHIAFRHPKGEEAKRYNVLQKLAYLVVIFVLLPLIILAGWAMSPWLDSLATGWVGWLGGRQSARTIHFIVAWLLVGFVAIHVFEVAISGAWNQLRSMVTGRYRVTSDPAEAAHE